MKWVQIIEVYFEAKGYFNEERFIIAIVKFKVLPILDLELEERKSFSRQALNHDLEKA